MNFPTIISGEASETDSEDENIKNLSVITAPTIQGAVITGEDSESDNENDASISSAVSALHDTTLRGNRNNEETVEKFDSLLHQKLKESNLKLRQDVENFCNTAIGDAVKNLNNNEQQLIKSQLMLQGAVTSFKSLTVSSLAIKNKLQSLLTGNFIPNININN